MSDELNVWRDAVMTQFGCTSDKKPDAAADKEPQIYAVSGGGYFQDDRSLLIEELRQYERLEAGWDGAEDDIAPSRVAIDEAINFVENLPPFVALPEPMVASDGQVGFFWHDADLYLDIGFRGQGECTFFGKSGNLKIKGKDAVNASDPVPASVLRFLAQVDHPAALERTPNGLSHTDNRRLPILRQGEGAPQGAGHPIQGSQPYGQPRAVPCWCHAGAEDCTTHSQTCRWIH